MANALYKLAKQGFLAGTLNIKDGNDIKVSLVKTTYVPNLTTDSTTADLGANIVVTSGALANKTVALGVFDADNITYLAVGANSACNLVIHEDAGKLIAFIDTAAAGALPVTPSGADIPVAWPVAGIFAL